MVINSANLAALERNFRAIYNGSYTSYTPVHPQFAEETSNNAASVVYEWLGAFPTMKKFTGELKLEDLVSSNWEVPNEEFAMGVSIPRKTIERDAYNLFRSNFARIGQRASLHPDRLFAKLLLGGFEEKDYTGKNFFDTNKLHVKGKKGTFSNKGTKKLSQANYEAALAALVGITDEEGEPIAPNSKTLLIVSPTWAFTARTILNASLVGGGNTNVSANTSDLLVWPMLGTSDAWFLLQLGDVMKPFIYQVEKKTEFNGLLDPNSEMVFKFEKIAYRAYGRYAAAYGMPQLAWGSTGADAA